jgi:hypothetical protein
MGLAAAFARWHRRFRRLRFPACPGVTKLVDEQHLHPDRLVLHNLNWHGLIVKR